MTEEYWRKPPSLEDKVELDEALIAEINNNADEVEVGHEEMLPVRRGGIIRLLSLLVIVSFLAITFNSFLPLLNMPSFDFVDRSRELAMDPQMQAYREAVVEIHTGSTRGTGFNIEATGLIVTNYHLVDSSSSAQINFLRERTYTGAVTKVFPKLDLALIRIDGEGLPALDLETATDLQQGDEVTVIGNPLWFSRIIIEGVVIGQTLLSGWDIPVYLIKAPVHKGNSGSPVINADGNVAAVIFATATSSQGEIIGLAVPVSSLIE